MALALDTPLTYLKGVGPARAEMLQSRGLETVEDLINYFPFRYEDRSNLKTIAQLKGDKMLAAKLLGIGKTTLYRKLKEYQAEL